MKSRFEQKLYLGLGSFTGVVGGFPLVLLLGPIAGFVAVVFLPIALLAGYRFADATKTNNSFTNIAAFSFFSYCLYYAILGIVLVPLSNAGMLSEILIFVIQIMYQTIFGYFSVYLLIRLHRERAI
jgi:biotin transporter BioY